MYEKFGALEKEHTGIAEFKLFLPDDLPGEGGGLPGIKDVRVVGTFLKSKWNGTDGVLMNKSPYVDRDTDTKGWLYSAETPVLKEDFYLYKYYITFENGTSRLINDPCCRWGGPAASQAEGQKQTSGFTIGGQPKIVVPKDFKPVPAQDLIIYELMIDDFTKNLPVNNRAPLNALLEDKLNYLVELGVNAIEFMPWTAWPSDDFSWGYNPFQYFSVAHQYVDTPTTPADKIFYLKQLIKACHDKGISVIMDSVFNHAEGGPEGIGFAYYWLYENTADSPFVGIRDKLSFNRNCQAGLTI